MYEGRVGGHFKFLSDSKTTGWFSGSDYYVWSKKGSHLCYVGNTLKIDYQNSINIGYRILLQIMGRSWPVSAGICSCMPCQRYWYGNWNIEVSSSARHWCLYYCGWKNSIRWGYRIKVRMLHVPHYVYNLFHYIVSFYSSN